MSPSAPIPQGSIILTPADARLLYQTAHIGELRSRNRVGNTAIYKLLTDLSVCAFTEPVNADSGNVTRHEPASEEPEIWTVSQLAKRSRRAPRTVRFDIERNVLPATKQSNVWLITRDNAHTYIESRKTP